MLEISSIFSAILIGAILLVLLFVFSILEILFGSKRELRRLKRILIKNKLEEKKERLWKENLQKQGNCLQTNKETSQILHKAYQQVKNKKVPPPVPKTQKENP